ncbi:DUF6065 family protein [Bradyrhizobium sp. LMTR 3]|uniref:DUF6065 family protein n=1 Tax=Bradyrhizobium sp. LMTR 3 TaxID=189873 RepID=UPI001AEC75D2|nr:DUF6065 family protein [Bradyrhizobium sp. LMTR 3]
MPKLVAYTMDGHAVRIRPAPLERDWMDATDQRFAYRCLPLNIANAHGWELLCPSGFSARWDGLNHKETIRIKSDLGTHAPVVSHFGHGVLTFHVPQRSYRAEDMTCPAIQRSKNSSSPSWQRSAGAPSARSF